MTTNTIYRVELHGRSTGGSVTLFHYATKGYATPTTHGSIPNTWIDGRLIQPLLMRRDLYGEGHLYGSQEITHGQVVLQNADGALDSFVSLGWDAEIIKIVSVNPSDLITETVVFQGVTEQASFDNDTVTFLVRDDSYYLDKPLQVNKYAGNNILPNGLEGTSELIGKPKPIVFGAVWNITPIVVNTSKLIYQVNDGAVSTIDHVYDMRSEITTRGADYTSTADMLANAPAAFAWRAYPAGGYFRLGSKPAGIVTADLNTATDWDSIIRLLLLSGAVPGGFGIDVTTTAAPGSNSVGVYWTDEITYLDAIKEVLTAINGSLQVYVSVTSRVFSLTRLEVPGTYTPVLSLDRTNILSGSLKKVVPSDPERGIPPWRVTVKGGRNYTVMTASDIAGSALDFDAARAVSEYQVAQTNTVAVQTQYPNAPELVFIGHGNFNTSAYLAGVLSGFKRSLFSVQVALETVASLSASHIGGTVLGPFLGTEFTVTYPRFNLNAGVRCALIGYSLDYQAQIAELLLFGITP